MASSPPPKQRKLVSSAAAAAAGALFVLLAPRSVTSTEGSVIVSLRHPRTLDGAKFVIHHDAAGDVAGVCELQRFADDPSRSWFVDDSVQEDGSLLVASPVDPLFLFLPALLDQAASAHFVPVDHLATDAQFPALGRLTALAGACLASVCDQRGSAALQGLRLNPDKLLQCLHAKVACCRAALIAAGHSMAAGAASVGFAQSASVDPITATRYAVGVVSEYLPPVLALQLAQSLALDVASMTAEEPPPLQIANKQLVREPTEDYSRNRKSTTLAAAAPKKKTPAQRSLEKVDTSKMKSMASFFKPAAKQ